MSARRRISQGVQNAVRERAAGYCEYCHTAEKWQYVRFTIDHIVSVAQGGADNIDNLALACFHCNRRKSDYTTGIDPETGLPSQLFHPRKMRWQDHFVWSQDRLSIVGVTPIGRATVEQLEMNRQRIRAIRLADIAVNRHPPRNDPVEATQ